MQFIIADTSSRAPVENYGITNLASAFNCLIFKKIITEIFHKVFVEKAYLMASRKLQKTNAFL